MALGVERGRRGGGGGGARGETYGGPRARKCPFDVGSKKSEREKKKLFLFGDKATHRPLNVVCGCVRTH